MKIGKHLLNALLLTGHKLLLGSFKLTSSRVGEQADLSFAVDAQPVFDIKCSDRVPESENELLRNFREHISVERTPAP